MNNKIYYQIKGVGWKKDFWGGMMSIVGSFTLKDHETFVEGLLKSIDEELSKLKDWNPQLLDFDPQYVDIISGWDDEYQYDLNGNKCKGLEVEYRREANIPFELSI